jgi:integrase
MGIGSARDLSLAQARGKAADCRRLLVEGKDPIRERNRAKLDEAVAATEQMTFDQCATAYIAAHKDGWRNTKHAAQWESTLRLHASPVIGTLPVADIALPQIMKILEPIWREKTETATRIRGRVESIIDWATVRGFRTGDNPARWRGHLDHLLPKPSKVAKVEHHAAVAFDQLQEFFERLRQQDGTGARALSFLILTGARSGEVRGATRGEIDFEAGVWTVPGERMKAGREHRVPLSSAALELIAASKAVSDQALLFPAPRGGQLSDMTLSAVMRRMKVQAVPHGFRSTFRDWCAECTDFPREVAEMALAHAISDKVEAAYRRGDLFDKRRQLMERWAIFCVVPKVSKRCVP